MFDVLIRNGLVIDGTGAPGRCSDVGVKAGLIAAVGNLAEHAGAAELDASGLVVCPGLIDAHVHSDVWLLAEPTHEVKLLQGVTTEIQGQDGMSYAPLSPDKLAFYSQYLSGFGKPEIDWDWDSVASFRERFEGTVAVNTAYLLPHGTVRLEVLGMRDIAFDEQTLPVAQRMIGEGLEQGAVGVSTGLSYFPGSYADTDELVVLCRAARSGAAPDREAVYVTHIRTSYRGSHFDPIAEALEVGRRAGVPVHISHLRTGVANVGQVGQLLKLIDAAVAKGEEVTLDTYPYAYGSGFALCDLPRWAHEGSVAEILARMRSEPTRSRLLAEVPRVRREELGASERVYSHLPSERNADLVGLTYSAAAAARGYDDPDELLLDLLIEERLEVGQMNEEPAPEIAAAIEDDIVAILDRPYAMVGSDGIHVGAASHPRTYGTFARLLGPLRRRNGVPLEKLISRMTSIPAKRFGLHDRGRVAVGLAADLIAFDPERIADTASLATPRSPAVGVEAVLVNGELAVIGGKPTGVLAGRALP